MFLFAGNAVIATGETIMKHTILPTVLAQGVIFRDIDAEFRGLALYNHALTGAVMTQMALILLIAMRPRGLVAAAFGLVLLVGLVSFGGRASLLMSMLTLIGYGGTYLVGGLLRRTLPRRALIASVGVMLVVWFLLTETSIGTRLLGKLNFNDESAETRSVQWMMVGLLNWQEFLFGISTERLDFYIYQLGLTYPFHIVENFWLVTLLNLGAVGFLVYVTGLMAFLIQLWRLAPVAGRVLIVTTILVASTSNSLSRKSNVLFVMTAAVVATTGFVASRRASQSLGRAAPSGNESGPSGLPPRGPVGSFGGPFEQSRRFATTGPTDADGSVGATLVTTRALRALPTITTGS